MKQQADLIVLGSQVFTAASKGKPKRGKALSDPALISPGAVAVLDGKIAAVGSPDEVLKRWSAGPERFFETGKAVVPGLVDSHTHPVFSGSRVGEFLLRSRGATYQEIAASGGGIASTVAATRQAETSALKNRTRALFIRMFAHGTTTVEAKSGYGLSLEEEIRALEILADLKKELPLEIVSTFMGAHALPPEYPPEKRDGYLRLLIEEMLPAVRRQNLAECVDVFCEEGAFTPAEAERILKAAGHAGLKTRIHAEEFSNLGGACLAASLGALSADHLLKAGDAEIAALAASGTIATLLPGTAFFLGVEYAPARRLIEGGAAVALATDFNAGSCLTENMQMVLSLACLKMKMTPEEAINAATLNAAFALGRGDRVGSLEAGKEADLLILDIPDYREWPYRFGTNLVNTVIKRGKIAWKNYPS